MTHKLRVLLLILTFFGGCKGEVVVPPQLIGVWTTAAPKYADRYMKLSERTLTYGIGEGEEVSHQIEKIDVEQGNGGTMYTLYYRDAEGEKWTLIFTYSPDTRTIQIKNSEELWEKTKPGDTG